MAELRLGHGAQAELGQRTEWLSRLYDITALLNEHGEIEPLLDAALLRLMETLDLDGGQCLLLEGAKVTTLAVRGLAPAFVRRLEAELDLGQACLVQEVLRTGGPVYAIGAGTCRWHKLAAAAGYETLLALPLNGRRGLLGVSVFYQWDARTFSEDEMRLLMVGGAQLATAIERARLLERERAQRQHLEAVQRAAAVVNSSLDLSQVLDSVLTELGHVVGYDSAAIILQQQDGFLIAAARGIPGFDGPRRIQGKNELSGTIARTHRPIILDDAQADHRFSRWLETGYVRGWMGVPLLAQEQYIGHLTADSRRPAAYTRADADRALSFAQQAAGAVVNARLHADVQAQLEALRETQNRLVQSEKLAAIGQLVSGVAHELNNPLGAIQLYGELLQKKLAGARRGAEADLEQILTQVQRASSIVEALLDFARQRPPERRQVRVNEVIAKTVELMSYELRTHNVTLDLDLAPGLPPILADPQQLQQVLVNLVNNAYQTMSQADGGGQLQISTGLQTASGVEAPAVLIAVADSGPGIGEDVLPHIFEPFYSTRQAGDGVGLGLSVCHGIVGEHGGRIWAENTPGTGATFYLQLPVSAGEEAGMDVDEEGPVRPDTAGHGKILVVDDEEGLRLAMQDILELLGYEVTVVASGQQALERIAVEEGQGYDLILCDIRMPGMPGPAFYRALLAANPGPVDYRRRVLFITGDSLNAQTRRFLEAGALPWLAKPFDMEQLVGRVRQMLEEATYTANGATV